MQMKSKPKSVPARGWKKHLAIAVDAAKGAGELMRKNLNATKKINHSEQHDIKLELDVRCQKLIEKKLREVFPEIPILGEEGITGDIEAAERWVVDPIDGTVNFTYGIPHACVSIALQRRKENGIKRGSKQGSAAPRNAEFETVTGVVYDPFTDELFTAIRGEPARLNGRKISVTRNSRLNESIVSVGFAKSAENLERMLPHFNKLVHEVRKIRIMGAAALAMVYVASGRFDAYVEGGVRLWDIAAGGLILECAGGDFWHEPVGHDYVYRIIANNGKLRKKLQFA
jgi:myo-inositol-1(or 4)-monophosphatase